MKLTRKQKAYELLRTLAEGPAFWTDERLTGKSAAAEVRRWLDSWVIPPILDLVPELKVREPEPSPQPTEREELVTALRELHLLAKEHRVLTGNGFKAGRKATQRMDAALKRAETVLARYAAPSAKEAG